MYVFWHTWYFYMFSYIFVFTYIHMLALRWRLCSASAIMTHSVHTQVAVLFLHGLSTILCRCSYIESLCVRWYNATRLYPFTPRWYGAALHMRWAYNHWLIVPHQASIVFIVVCCRDWCIWVVCSYSFVFICNTNTLVLLFFGTVLGFPTCIVMTSLRPDEHHPIYSCGIECTVHSLRPVECSRYI